MTRFDANAGEQVQARLADEGLHKLYKRPEWDDHNCREDLRRSWDLVIPSLKRRFRELVSRRKPWPLYLWGSPGHGKTAAALALCDKVANARYWSLDLSLNDPPWLYGDVHLAVLDEVGSVRVSDKARLLEYTTTKRMFEWRLDRPTIYIGNQPLSQLQELFDGRMFSRLSSGTAFQLRDRDRRIREATG